MIVREIPFEIELIKNLESWLRNGRDHARAGRSGQSFLGKITYGDLAEEVPQTPNGRGIIPCSSVLGDALGRIQEECKACGVPCLAAMVVRADTSFPGIGFFNCLSRCKP